MLPSCQVQPRYRSTGALSPAPGVCILVTVTMTRKRMPKRARAAWRMSVGTGHTGFRTSMATRRVQPWAGFHFRDQRIDWTRLKSVYWARPGWWDSGSSRLAQHRGSGARGSRPASGRKASPTNPSRPEIRPRSSTVRDPSSACVPGKDRKSFRLRCVGRRRNRAFAAAVTSSSATPGISAWTRRAAADS
jgi:hypothetical protein